MAEKKLGVRLPYVRPRKDSNEQPKVNASRYPVEKENWINIPVPAIIDENLFDAVQEQLEENKKRARIHKKGETYLLQGLLVCKYCGRAYCGEKSIRRYTNIQCLFILSLHRNRLQLVLVAIKCVMLNKWVLMQ